MLQELAAGTGASGWAIGSLIFFLIAWLAIAVRVVRARRDEMESRARLALDDEAPERMGIPPGCAGEALTRGHHG